jgi:hypothetical protein
MQKQKFITAASVAVLGLSAVPALAAVAPSGPKVNVRIEGLSSTLLPGATFQVPGAGSITQGGVTAGQCPADSAQGALNVSTHGRWKGSFDASYKEYFITSILGDTPNPKRDYFEIFVNHKAASAGACELKLKAGDHLLFAVVPDTGAPETPLGLSTNQTGAEITAKVVAYTAQGTARPLKGATLRLGSSTVKTGANGTARVKVPSKSGMLVATAPGHIRDETAVNVAQAL